MVDQENIIGALTHEEALEVDRDMQLAAEIAALIYVSDAKPGISRLKKNGEFIFMYRNKPVVDKKQLERIKKLAIPPAWEEVWICPYPNGHLQATGKDARNRKQYKYHSLWHQLRNETKFHRMLEFGKQLPALRKRLEQDISAKELNEHKVIATVISLMERTYLRIGNNGYEKMYGSYGLSTLKDKHVSINGHQLNFSFKGKKGIVHKVSLKNRKLASIVKDCKDIPGKELFQYFDSEGNSKPIDSGKINQYIKDATGGEFSAKDFRTWAGTLNIISSFRSMEKAIDEAQKKKKIVAAIDEVSAKLGNTRTVCRKYYIHPGIIKLYEEGIFDETISQLDSATGEGYTDEEKTLMQLLEKMHT